MMECTARELQWMLERLPAPTADSPPHYNVARPMQVKAWTIDETAPQKAACDYLTFKKVIRAEGSRRWYEWALEIEGKT